MVSYVARVKLSMGTLGGELAAEVPFTLMNPPLEETAVRQAGDAERNKSDLKHLYASPSLFQKALFKFTQVC